MSKKIKPLFWQEKSEGEKLFPAKPDWIQSSKELSKLIITPYTEFVPLLYTFLVEKNYFGNYYSKNSRILNRLPGNIKEKVEREQHGLIRNGVAFEVYENGSNDINRVRKRLLEEIESYVKFDEQVSLNKNYQWNSSGSYNAKSAFTRPVLGSLSMRSFNGLIGGLSMIVKENTEYNPHIMAVVLPEDLVYQKMHMLLYESIDMEKVIFLVDRELDTSGFPKKPVRALYKKYLLPEMQKYNCNIWKVPLDFIKNSCFQTDFDIKTTNILEKKKQINQVTQEFLDKYVHEIVDDFTLTATTESESVPLPF